MSQIPLLDGQPGVEEASAADKDDDDASPKRARPVCSHCRHVDHGCRHCVERRVIVLDRIYRKSQETPVPVVPQPSGLHIRGQLGLRKKKKKELAKIAASAARKR